MVPDLLRDTLVQVHIPTDKPMFESESSLMTTDCPVGELVNQC